MLVPLIFCQDFVYGKRNNRRSSGTIIENLADTQKPLVFVNYVLFTPRIWVFEAKPNPSNLADY